MKISCLFILLSGALALSSALPALPGLLSPATSAIAQGLKSDLLSQLNEVYTANVLDNILEVPKNILRSLPLGGLADSIKIKMGNVKFLQPALRLLNNNQVMMTIPASLNMMFQTLNINNIIQLMANFKATFTKPLLKMEDCQLIAQSVDISVKNSFLPADMVEKIVPAVKTMLYEQLESKVCPMIRTAVSQMDPQWIDKLLMETQPQTRFRSF